MQTILLVGLGGAAGSIFRHGLNLVLSSAGRAIGLPLGTLAVNVIGSLAIGALAAWMLRLDPAWRGTWRALLMIGLLGGFTTFSSFSLDVLDLIRAGQPWRAVTYVVLSNVLCLAAAAAGWRVMDSSLTGDVPQ